MLHKLGKIAGTVKYLYLIMAGVFGVVTIAPLAAIVILFFVGKLSASNGIFFFAFFVKDAALFFVYFIWYKMLVDLQHCAANISSSEMNLKKIANKLYGLFFLSVIIFIATDIKHAFYIVPNPSIFHQAPYIKELVSGQLRVIVAQSVDLTTPYRFGIIYLAAAFVISNRSKLKFIF